MEPRPNLDDLLRDHRDPDHTPSSGIGAVSATPPRPVAAQGFCVGIATVDEVTPDNAEELVDVLQRRIDQVGLVDPADGPRLQAALRPGQRLVSREGDLWRWDGFTARAEAPITTTGQLRALIERGVLSVREDGNLVLHGLDELKKQLPPDLFGLSSQTGEQVLPVEGVLQLREQFARQLRLTVRGIQTAVPPGQRH